MRTSTARAQATRRGPALLSCLKILLPPVLIGLALLTGACVRQDSSELVSDQPVSPDGIARISNVVDAVRSNIGVPYRFGGTSPATGFDCSGLVCWSYSQVGIQLPRSAREQLLFGDAVEKRKDLEPGDIVVFKGMRNRTGWHAGIYTGDGKFVHSPTTGKSVTESSLNEAYYAKRYAGARRIPLDGSAAAMYADYKARQKMHAPTEQESKKSRKQKTIVSKAKRNEKKKAPAGKKNPVPGAAGQKAGNSRVISGT
jgi:cell wall-associated NlpC family hydrolase